MTWSVEPLVDRGAELDQLGRLVGELAEGRSAVLSIRGAPGTGRTTLLRRAAELVRRRGLRVIEAHCAPSDTIRPDHVARQAFAGLGLTMPPTPDNASDEALRSLAADLLAATGGEPLALLVHDVHWADDRSQRWLRALAAAPDRAMLLAFTETTGLAPWNGPEWPARRVIELAPLTWAGLATLVRRAGHPEAGDREIRIAFRATRGNPALLCEGLRRVSALPFWADAFPEVCTRIAAERFERLLDGLPRELMTVLRAVAVCQGGFPTALLAELSGCRATLRGHLETLGAMGLVSGTAIGQPVAEAVLAGMAEADRNALFVRAAALGHGGCVAKRIVGGLLTRTRPVGEPWVVDVLRVAAREARAAGRPDEAVTLLSRALQEPLPPDRRAEVLLALGTAELPVSPTAGDRHLLRVLAGEDGAWSTRLAAADLLLARGDGRATARAIAAAFRRPELSTSDRSGLLGLYWLPQAHPQYPGELGRSDLPLLPERPADPAQAAAAAIRLAMRGAARPSRARGLARVALALATAGPVPLAAGIAAVETLRLTGDFAEAGERCDELLGIARARGAGVLIGRTLLARAQIRFSAGLLAGAAEDLGQVHEAVPASEWHPATRCHIAAVEVLLNLERGRIDEAECVAERAPELAGAGLAGIFLLYATSRVRSATGRVEDALSGFFECGRWLSSHGWRNPELLPWRSAAATCLVAGGDRAGGERLVADEIAAAKQWGTAAVSGGARLRAAAVAGSDDTAAEHLQEAVRLLERSEARLAYGRALLELAATQLAAGERAGAAIRLAAANELAERHQWDHLGARLRELAREFGGTTAPTVLGLSRAQRQVAQLAAQGVSNAGIADRLAVTKRTVELHLTQVYRKLGIGGRNQLRQALGTACLET